MKKIKIAMAIIAVTAFMLTIKSCKKVDNSGTVNAKETEASRAAAIKAIKEKYGNVSAGIVFNVNKTADEYFYKDATGKMVSLYGNNTTSASGPNGGNGPSPCRANCNTTSNPADLRIIYTLDYVERFYMCEATADKSTLSVKWTVSVPFSFGYTLNNFPPLTYGNVQFKNSSGTVINTLQAINGSLTLNMIGADPGCPTWNNLWEITYSFTNVTNGNFASGNTIEASLSLENDCSLVGYLVTSGYVSAPSFSQNAYLPCNRLDAIFFNPPFQNGAPSTVTGLYTGICSPPSGMQPIEYHQLEYRKVNTPIISYEWDAQSTPVYNGWPQPANNGPSPIFSPYGGTSNLNSMIYGTGKWLLRYRNVKTGTCDVITDPTNTLNNGGDDYTNGNWGNLILWNTEMWDMF